ncbi:MAG: hypothetical protein F6K03_03420, partial [Kamptonema sp. SIO4C4]|nr:hypothetical protein [Kamptonema sp. SIO4C4]
QPDLILQLWKPSKAELHYIENLGYQSLSNGIYVLQNSSAVNPKQMRQWTAH